MEGASGLTGVTCPATWSSDARWDHRSLLARALWEKTRAAKDPLDAQSISESATAAGFAGALSTSPLLGATLVGSWSSGCWCLPPALALVVLLAYPSAAVKWMSLSATCAAHVPSLVKEPGPVLPLPSCQVLLPTAATRAVAPPLTQKAPDTPSPRMTSIVPRKHRTSPRVVRRPVGVPVDPSGDDGMPRGQATRGLGHLSPAATLKAPRLLALGVAGGG